MFKKLQFFFLFVFFLFFFFGQAQQQAANWYFGNKAGLNFSSGNPTPLLDGQLNQLEGCASISDSDGNLLFYTDGSVVYNQNHQLMQNGTGLLGNSSSSQSAIVIPAPNSTNLYYIFTVDAAENASANGLNYSVVNMDLAGGLGAIIPDQKNMLLYTPVSEKVTAIRHTNGTDFWVVSHKLQSDQFISYLVTQAGVNATPVTTAIGDFHDQGGFSTTVGARGCLKASPDGTKLACAKNQGNQGLELFDFDKASGVVSNAMDLSDSPYFGVEFSPNSNILYASTNFTGQLHQYNASLGTEMQIINSKIILSTKLKYGALQLGIDGKMYIAQFLSYYLSVVNNPNQSGLACNFNEDAVDLGGRQSLLGLPAYIQDFFQFAILAQNTCLNQDTFFEIDTDAELATISWNFGDPASGAGNTSTLVNPSHEFSTTGTFTVTADLTTTLGYSLSLTQEVTVYENPEATIPDNLEECSTSSGSETATFNLTNQNATILNNYDAQDYSITYFTEEQDAEANINKIQAPSTFTNTSNPQVIYARLTNIETGCYDVVSFNLEVNPSPLLPEISDLVVCSENQQATAEFDLTQIEIQVLENQSIMQVLYFESLQDAENNSNPINNTENYTNQANPQSIYIRIIDPETNCYTIGSFIIKTAISPETLALNDIFECENASTSYATFDLSQQESIITAQYPTAIIEYYTAVAEAENGENPITNPQNFTNTEANQSIFVKIIDANTGCFALSSFNLVVTSNPLTPALSNLETCDIGDVDEISEFDLTKQNSILLENQTNAEIAYFTNLDDAEQNTNVLGNPTNFVNTNNPQQIYVRIEAGNNQNCYSVTSFFVEVKALVEEDFELESCSPVNLTQIEEGLSENYIFTYYDSLENAEQETQNISNPKDYVEDNDVTLYVRIEDDQNCVSIHTLELKVIQDCTIPEGFSPNNDGTNDYFDLSFLSPNGNGVDITIFNRYGRVVYENKSYLNQWDGKDKNGNTLPASTYYYVLKFKEPNSNFKPVLKRWVYLHR